MKEVVTTRTFTHEDQIWFAEASGDWNEIHVDPEVARRSIGGEQVVHGMHSVLWALDSFLSRRRVGVIAISATFRKPVHLGEEVELHVSEDRGPHVRFAVTTGSSKLLDIQLELAEAINPRSDDYSQEVEFPTEPIDLTIDQIEGREGTLITPNVEAISSGFPAAVSVLGSAAVSQISAVSRLIGMVCPGRYSLLSKVDLVVDLNGSNSEIQWSVSRADSRVSAVAVDMSGGIISGSVQAFVRPRPTVQPGLREVSREVLPDEFEGQRALVVGGSRGLGELTTKVLASGGADVVFTWLHSSSDSERVIDEIASTGRQAISQRLDVADPFPAVRELSLSRDWVPTHLYYYATPPIFVRRSSSYDPILFSRFAEIYLRGFADVVEACRQAGIQHLTAFFPSSVAIDEREESLLEYAAAKAAGEVVAQTMATANTWFNVVVRRLPRLATDQTATFLPVSTEDAMDAIIEVVRAMNTASGGVSRDQ